MCEQGKTVQKLQIKIFENPGIFFGPRDSFGTSETVKRHVEVSEKIKVHRWVSKIHTVFYKSYFHNCIRYTPKKIAQNFSGIQ